MARITYAKISGLAGRKKDLELEFDRHRNVIFGVNGVGKTTLLKILHGALYFDEDVVSGLPFTRAEVGVFSVDQDKEIIREIENQPEKNDLFGESSPLTRRQLQELRAKTNWAVKDKKATQAEKARFAHEYLPTTRLFSVNDLATARRYASPDVNDAGLDAMMEAQLQQQWLKFTSPLQVKIQSAQQQGIAQILSMILSPDAPEQGDSELEPDVAYSLARSFLHTHSQARVPGTKQSFIARYQKDKTVKAVVNEISKLERDVADLRRPRDQLEALLNELFLNKRVDLSGEQIKVRLLVGEGKGSQLRLSHLSSGEKQALYILIHALRAASNSLIVDEPEISMHIDWQRQLIDSILELNPSTQVIMATHSPEVMAAIPDKCIFEL